LSSDAASHSFNGYAEAAAMTVGSPVVAVAKHKSEVIPANASLVRPKALMLGRNCEALIDVPLELIHRTASAVQEMRETVHVFDNRKSASSQKLCAILGKAIYETIQKAGRNPVRILKKERRKERDMQKRWDGAKRVSTYCKI
jgi:hypothetical protein